MKLVTEATKEELEAALAKLNDPEPEYCGYTEKQWQFVIDGGFLVRFGSGATLVKLTGSRLDDIINGSFINVSIVREKGIKQPAFGRDVNHRGSVLAHHKDGSLALHATECANWEYVDWFIEL